MSPNSRDRNRQARRGRNGCHDRHSGRRGLLRDLEARATAHDEDAIVQRQSILKQRPADHLVDRVVPADVLPDREQITT